MSRLVVLAALVLFACSPAPADDDPAEPQTPVATSSEAPAVDLAGDWRVAGIDGAALEAPYGIALVADETNIWWQPECALQYREYSISGSRFTAPTRSNANLEVCDIGYPLELEQVWSALEAADTIERTPENGVLIHGNERSLLLFSQ